MATYKKKKVHHSKKQATPVVNASSSLLNVPNIPKGEVMVLDTEELPIMGNFGRSVENSYPKEFAIIDSMKVNQSGVFLQGKMNIITAIRTRIQKLSSKKFVVKKINTTHCRLWRVPDGTVTVRGGRKKASKFDKVLEAVVKTPKNNWGGKRTAGTGKAHARGPKLTHKDGTPIVPTISELNSVES